MKSWLKILTLWCCTLAILSALASATQVVYRDPQQLGQQSELVVRGKVLSTSSYWNEKHTKIFTRTRIGIDETYKGVARPTVDLVQLGGTVGKVKVTVDGALQWKVGEEVLIFVEPYDAVSFQISGFSQGKFRIERDHLTGTVYVDAALPEGVSLVGAPSAAEPAPPRPSGLLGRQRVTLDDFISHALGRRAEPGVER